MQAAYYAARLTYFYHSEGTVFSIAISLGLRALPGSDPRSDYPCKDTRPIQAGLHCLEDLPICQARGRCVYPQRGASSIRSLFRLSPQSIQAT